ncbi:MAG: hypothetical protein NVSMB45_00610 [Ginsengibacter sp.]
MLTKLYSGLTLFGLLILAGVDGQNYKVTLHTPNYKSGLAYLTFYYGKNLNIQDSAIVSSTGTAVFTKKGVLEPGIYSIIFPGKTKLVDFLVDKSQQITITADTSDLVGKTILAGSPENELFKRYQQFILSKSDGLMRAQAAYAQSKNKADSIANEKKYIVLNKELTDYREKVITENPKSMLAALFSAMQESTIPIKHAVTKQDSLNNYYHYRTHYWDGISFMDNRIIRSPFFLPKLERYFREVLPQSADTIIKESDYLLLLARNNDGMYKFMINWLTDEYISPKYMGQDAVFVHLFEKYHATGVSKWLSEKQLKQISDRAYMLMSNLVGSAAADLRLVDTAGKEKSLYNVISDYTIVVFWNPTCSHCKEQIPKLDSIYKAKWKQEGVKVYAVLSENEKAKWIEFINQHHLRDWVNVYQTPEMKKEEESRHEANFRQLYDVTQTPTIYLLDKDKRIVAKKLTIEQIDDLLQVKIKTSKAK